MSKLEMVAREILEDTCETDEIFEDYDMDLIDAGYIDSFSILNVIVGIEEKTGVHLNPEEINANNIRTVNSFIDFLRQIVSE